jgi:hypothetical protein
VANNFSKDLKDKGFNVKNTDDTNTSDYEKTIIEYSVGHKGEAEYINGILGGGVELRQTKLDGDEITIILGKDYLSIFIWTD